MFYRKHGFPLGQKFHNGKGFLSKSQEFRSQESRTDSQGEAPNLEMRLTQQKYQAHMPLTNPISDIGATPNIQISSIVSQSPNIGKNIFSFNSYEDKGIAS